MGGKVTDAVVFFCAGVDDGVGMVREACEMGTVLLREKNLDLFPFFGIVEDEGIIRAGGEAEFA